MSLWFLQVDPGAAVPVGVPRKRKKIVPQERMQQDTGELRVDSPVTPPDRFSETLAETQVDFPSPVDVLTPSQPGHAPGHVAERPAEQRCRRAGGLRGATG